MIRNIIIGLLLAVAALAGVLVFNTLNYGAEPVGGRVTLPAAGAFFAHLAPGGSTRS